MESLQPDQPEFSPMGQNSLMVWILVQTASRFFWALFRSWNQIQCAQGNCRSFLFRLLCSPCFEQKQVRRIQFHDEWWFVISDVVAVLTDSVNPSDYLKKLRKRDQSLSDAFKGGGQLVPPLGIDFDTAGGRPIHEGETYGKFS